MGARHHPVIETSVSPKSGAHGASSDRPQDETKVAFFWDHPPLMPHRPWWQQPLQIVTFLLREFEGLRSSTLPQGLFQHFLLPLPCAMPNSWMVLFLLGSKPISFLVLQSSFFFFFFFHRGSDNRTQQAEEAGTPVYVLWSFSSSEPYRELDCVSPSSLGEIE